jgi:VanZ family protein
MAAGRSQFDWKLFNPSSSMSSHCLPDDGFLFYSCRMRKYFLNIRFSQNPFLKSLPGFLVMLAIFLFSARPSTNLPQSIWERIFFKGGHVMGYALLAWSYWRATDFSDNRRWVAWLLAVLYAVSDEYHQSFVPGRHPSAFDVLFYDNLGALSSLWLAKKFIKQKQPDVDELAAEQTRLMAKS